MDWRFDALRTRVWGVHVEHLGKKRNAGKNGFCQAGNEISRASLPVSPMLEQQHRRRDPGQDSVEVATVAVDCCFLRKHEESIPVFEMRNRETRLLSAHAVPMKGAVVEWTARQVVRDLESLGHHGRLVIRCDQEEAIKSWVSEVARMRGDAVTISEHSAVGDSQGTASLSVLQGLSRRW